MLNKSWYVLITILINIVLLLTVSYDTTQAAPPNPRSEKFEPAPCRFDLYFSDVEGESVECGYLTVPAQHDNPAGPQLRLAVAILKSTSNDPAADPLVMAQGGPGGSTIDTYGWGMATNPIRETRDIILFDQRGTLYSEPFLSCDEVTEISIKTLDQDLTIEQSTELQKEALTACRDRLVLEGVNLAVFNSLENAADVDALRAALGYDQINFYGVSYGTLLGLHLIRDFPEGLRSVILDAVVPPQTNFLVEGLHSQNRAFSQLFEACLADPTCSAEFPDLEEKFFETVSRLNEQPVVISLTDPDTGRSYDALLNGDSLIGLTFQLLYGAEFIPALPKMINDVSDGNYSTAINVLPLLVFDRTFGQGMYFSVLCAEDSDFEVDDIRLDGVRPQFAEHADLETQALLDICEVWNVPELDAVVDLPVRSDVPTLLLSGRFDPITPPSFAERTAETLTNSYFYTFPSGAHGGAMGEDVCGNVIAKDFLRDPTTQPDVTCLTEAAPISFYRSNLPRVEAIIKLANLSPGYLIPWSIAGLALLGLLTAWVVWPFMFIVNRLRSRKAQTRTETAWVDVLSRWLGLFVGTIGGLFYAGFLAVAVYAVFYLTILLIIGSLPAWTIPLFLLPLLLVLLTAGMVIALGAAWFRGSMPIWERVYYTFLTGCAVVFLAALAQMGLVTALL